jgi:hypothetical protein
MMVDFVQPIGVRDAFEPSCRLVLGVADIDGGSHGRVAPERPDPAQQSDQQTVKGQEERVIEACENHADDRLEDDREAANQQRRDGLNLADRDAGRMPVDP